MQKIVSAKDKVCIVWYSKEHEFATLSDMPSNRANSSACERTNGIATYGIATTAWERAHAVFKDPTSVQDFNMACCKYAAHLEAHLTIAHAQFLMKHNNNALRKTCYGLLTQQRPLAPFSQRT